MLARRTGQLVECQITIELVQVDQLLQAVAQGALPFQQLLLVGRAHQEELAGGLIAGDAGNGLGFIGQLLGRTDPLTNIVAGLELQQAADAKGDQ
ncbi:hypothetical protein D3C78_982440 [compost metagenome]